MADSRFVAYYRVSTQKQGESGLGLEAQRRAVRDYLGRSRRPLAEYTETESGKVAERPKLREALEACRAHRATLLIAKLDRLSRNVRFTAELMDSGIRFVACDNPTATDLTVHILAAVAQNEAKQISQRTRAALQAAKRRGRRLGWAIPSRKLEQRRAVKSASAANRQRAQRFAADMLPVIEEIRGAGRTTLAGIADSLNKRGERTARGKRWYPTTVRNILARTSI